MKYRMTSVALKQAIDEHDDHVQRPQVDVGYRRRDRRQHQERGEDQHVDPDRDDVFGVSASCVSADRSGRGAGTGRSRRCRRSASRGPYLDRVVVGRAEAAALGQPGEPGEDAEADDHVQGVQAGHREVEREEDLRRAGLGALASWKCGPGRGARGTCAVLVRLDPEEDATRAPTVRRGRRSLPPRPICGAWTASAMVRLLVISTAVLTVPRTHVEVMAGAREALGMEGAVDEVHQEQARRRTSPPSTRNAHMPRRDGLALLLDVVELVGERGCACAAASANGGLLGARCAGRRAVGVRLASRPACVAKFSVGGGEGLPLEARRPPGVRAGRGAVAQRPDQVDQRDHVADAQDGGARGRTRSAPETHRGTRGSAAACRDSPG